MTDAEQKPGEALKADVDRQLAQLSRQFAHSLMDLDAAIDCVALEADRRLKRLEVRVDKLEGAG